MLGRKAHNISMDIYHRKAQIGNRQVTRPGSKHKNKPTPEGSHVYKRGYLFR
jgi:hypothetical protein